MRRLAAGLCVLGALILAGCGSSQIGGDYGGQHPDYRRALAAAPKPLAGLYDQADRLLSGGVEAFKAQLTRLRGHPVVVNKWASWCAPCRAEAPVLQHAAAKLGTRVAFFGVDSEDSTGTGKQFLSEFPMPYPSYEDPDQKIAAAMNANLGFPSTAFYDSSGKLVHVQTGPYQSESNLRADIRRYAR